MDIKLYINEKGYIIMKYKKSKFKSVVINIKKIKKIVLFCVIAAFCLWILLSINISDVNINFLQNCIISNFNYKNNVEKLSYTNEKALIKAALSYIDFKSENKNFKNEWINKNTDFELVKKEKTEEKSIISDSISIKNETKYSIDKKRLLSEKPNFDLNKDKPCVLIVHTHTSESYTSNGEFETMDTDRTLDPEYNMIKIGNIFKETLEKNGIKTIHDKTIHDYPSYTSSYKRTLDTIENHLKQYPSIEIVLDIHRDALIKDDGTKIKLTTDINGVKAAQVMIVCGSNAGGLEFDTWEENLKFALQIQKNMENTYPELARPLLLSENRYNMHMTKGSLLLEIGTNGNSINEAINGAKFMAESLVKTILELAA